MSNEAIHLSLNDRFDIVAEVYNSGLQLNSGGDFFELPIYIWDKQNDVVYQDICLIRQKYTYCKNSDKIETGDIINCLVYGDETIDDYTDEFSIPIQN